MSLGEIGFSATSAPMRSLLPITRPRPMPAPAMTIEYARDQWSRPPPATLAMRGERPCSLIQTTSVSSSRPR